MRRKNILCFDISSSCTGWAVLSAVGELLSFGTIRPDKKLCLAEKLCFFRREIVSLIKNNKPLDVGVEDVYIRHVSSAVVLAKFAGVAIQAIFEKTKKSPKIMTATHARKVLGLKSLDKKQAFLFVKNKFGLDVFEFSSHNDITDAVIIGLAVIKDLSGSDG